MSASYDTIFINLHLATMDEKISAPYGMIEDAAVAVKHGRIEWLGKVDDLPSLHADEVHDCGGNWLTPGLVDCHTHVVFGGNRAQEFEQRLQGASYEDIAKAGGGIVSTVKATRDMSEDDLLFGATGRLLDMINHGVTTLEIKSGYGLDVETEIKMLTVAKRLEGENVRVRTTFLGAHAVPPEYAGNADGYIDLVCEQMIPEIARLGLADAVDGFCENIGFTPEQIERVFKAAQTYGLPVKLHAEQLSNQGGTKLAAQYKALSADHLEYLDEEGVKAMADAGTVAVLLPGAFYVLQETQKPPLDSLRSQGVPIALATDCNPGSSPITSPLIILNMACTLFGMTPEQALAGMTREGAKALGLHNDIGTLEIGKCADFALWDVEHPSELSYWMGNNCCLRRVIKGVIYA
ncbi:MAG TPA: imidazolonepropionase [Hellea balneolensis]|uniref:Imidazolonepropionase n=1 Tax=Hellea balneolensis TaxID=287478 RepID=A0A7C3C288_9PROT|nr:imidazolonepropionase [Hellea balneolensis]